jgi:hypothetical protein
MMKIWLLFLLMMCKVWSAHAQSQLNKLMARDVSCRFEGPTISLSDTSLYAQARNVSYSYGYWYPKYFTEVWPKEDVVGEVRTETNVYVDTVTYISPDKQAIFKLFAGQVVPFPLQSRKRQVKAADVLAVEKAVDDYIKIIKAGKDKELGKAKITWLCKGVKGYNYSIQLRARKADRQYNYKIVVAELPATGELIFSHLLYQYNIAVKDKYEALGNTLVNSFITD